MPQHWESQWFEGTEYVVAKDGKLWLHCEKENGKEKAWRTEEEIEHDADILDELKAYLHDGDITPSGPWEDYADGQEGGTGTEEWTEDDWAAWREQEKEWDPEGYEENARQ